MEFSLIVGVENKFIEERFFHLELSMNMFIVLEDRATSSSLLRDNRLEKYFLLALLSC